MFLECRRMWRFIFTLPREPPLWELESRWTFESSERDCRGQNLIYWWIIYIIGKILELKCLKWVRMTHLDISNISYGQKKGQESNWQFDSWPLNIKNHPNFLTCRWCATYRWKALDEGYNFAWNFISIGGLYAKLWAPKVTGVPVVGISGLAFRSLGTNDIWVLVPWLGTKYSIKGKVVVSPKFGPWWVLWVRVCLRFVLAPKVL
jgi:hypothetical protein